MPQPCKWGASRATTVFRVENNIHWLRDAVCDEGACRSRNPNSACALALLRTALLPAGRSASLARDGERSVDAHGNGQYSTETVYRRGQSIPLNLFPGEAFPAS
jgi:hypothetical protein